MTTKHQSIRIMTPWNLNECLKQAYDRACEATSDLSAAGHKDADSTTRDRIKYAYNLSKDLQRAIKGILEIL